MLKTILQDPILGNPLIWAGTFFAIVYFSWIFFQDRGLQKWWGSQEKRWKQRQKGEPVDPSPSYYIDGEGRVHADIVGLSMSPHVKKLYDLAEEIVRLQNKLDGTEPPVHG